MQPQTAFQVVAVSLVYGPIDMRVQNESNANHVCNVLEAVLLQPLFDLGFIGKVHGDMPEVRVHLGISPTNLSGVLYSLYAPSGVFQDML